MSYKHLLPFFLRGKNDCTDFSRSNFSCNVLFDNYREISATMDYASEWIVDASSGFWTGNAAR